MDWRQALYSGSLTYLIALLAYYPLLVAHFLRHHQYAWMQALNEAALGHHVLDALLFAIPFILIGVIGHRRILAGQAGRAILLPAFVAVILSILLVSAGPPEILAVAFLTSVLGFAGSLFLSPLRTTPRRATGEPTR